MKREFRHPRHMFEHPRTRVSLELSDRGVEVLAILDELFTKQAEPNGNQPAADVSSGVK